MRGIFHRDIPVQLVDLSLSVSALPSVLGGHLARGLRRNAWFYGAILLFAAAGQIVSGLYGLEDYFQVMLYLDNLHVILFAFLAAFVIGHAVFVMTVKRPTELVEHLVRDYRERLLLPERLTNGLLLILALPIFFSVFTSFKIMIPRIHPFSWDETFATTALPMLFPDLGLFDERNDFNFVACGNWGSGMTLPCGTLGALSFSGFLTSVDVVSMTPSAQIAALSATVDALESGGSLNLGQANSLRAKLAAALARLPNGQVQAAGEALRREARAADNQQVRATVNILGAFVRQVQAMFNSKRLTFPQALSLIGPAQSIIEDLLAE